MRAAARILAAVAVAAAPALAGPDESGCSYPLQECLDMMVENVKDRGWLGIEYEIDEEKGTSTVLRVVPGSPAEAAGFREGDLLLTLEGVELGRYSEAEGRKIKKAMVPGNSVVYVVLRDGKRKKLKPTLAPITEQVLAQWVGRHMLDHYQAPPGPDRE